MKLKKHYFVIPMITLGLLSGLWVVSHSQHKHHSGRAIASDEKVEKEEDKIKNLEDLVACQKKVIADLKDDMAKKIDDLKSIVADYDKKQEKKKDDKKDEVKVSENQPDDQQTLAVLMHLTNLIQSRQLNYDSAPQMGMSYMPMYDHMMPQFSFYRDFYENTMFYDQIGMGRNYLQSSYPRSPMGMGMNHHYQNPYQDQFLPEPMGLQQNLLGHIPSSLQRMPMLGDEFNFSQQNGLMRHPSSNGFNF